MLKLWTVLALTFVLLLAACGGDDDDDSGDDGANGPTATEATDGGDNGEETDAPEETDAGDDGEETDAPEETGAGDDDGGGSDFHACDVMTSEEVGAIVGAEMGEGRDYLATGPGATQCEWISADSANTVYVEVMTEGGPDWYEAIHFEAEDLEEIAGVGDEATWDTFLDSLDAIEGDKFVSVQPIFFFREVDDKAVAIELAKLALERVP